MVRHPREYAWSSYRAHALGKADALVSDHALYRALGRSGPDRQSAYRELFLTPLDAGFVDALRVATHGGWALGDRRFTRHIAQRAGSACHAAAEGQAVETQEGQTAIKSTLTPILP